MFGFRGKEVRVEERVDSDELTLMFEVNFGFLIGSDKGVFLCLRTRIFRAVDERFNITIIPKSRKFQS